MKVMSALYNNYRLGKKSYEHFESIEGLFYNRVARHKIVSVNGFAIDIDKLESDFRITRFVRDPRDLIVSGYYYHLKGAEPWFRFNGPTEKYWAAINGNIPKKMPSGISYSSYLKSISFEEGLITEIEFRKYQLDSIRNWQNDERIKTFKYEDILGNEGKVFDQVFRFYELSAVERKVGVQLSKYFALNGKGANKKHIRNAEPNQWKNHFTKNVEIYFNDHYYDLLTLLEYES